MVKKFTLFFMALIVVLASSCSNDDIGIDGSTELDDDSTKYVAFDSDLGDDVDYAIFGSDRLGYFYEFQNQDSGLSATPERLIVYDDNKSMLGISVLFDEDGLPEFLISDNSVMALGNFDGTLFDVAIVANDGSAYVYEDVESGFSWSEYTTELLNATITNSATTATALNLINTAVNSAGSAVTLVSTENIGDTTSELAYIGDASEIMSLSNASTLVDLDSSDTSLAVSVLSKYASGSSLLSSSSTGVSELIASTVSTIADGATTVADTAYTTADDNGNTSLALSCISTGIGPIKMTLSWNDYGDIDLHCIDPSDTHIYYSNKQSYETGGWLDYDNTAGGVGSVENIYFDTPYDGEYQVYVKYYSEKLGVSSIDYNIVVLVNNVNITSASTRTITGAGSIDEILTFEIEDGRYVSTRSQYFSFSSIDWNNLPAK